MQSTPIISESVAALLACPVCRSPLNRSGEEFICTNPECATHFPFINGIPILINDQHSIFSIKDYLDDANKRPDAETESFKNRLVRLLPALGQNANAHKNYDQFAKLLTQPPTQPNKPKVLIVGGRVIGSGMEALASNTALELIETDVAFGPRTMLICDGHDLPFKDGLFDAVIVQAVLEHVADPYACVEEIFRVMKPQGLIYAETPFMQQVHEGRFDFTRFTHLGHRRLFRKFDEITSGPAGGPGTMLAWSWYYFVLSFIPSKGILRDLAATFARLTAYFLKYFDGFLSSKPGVFDAASGYYFMGRKSDQILSDRELIKLYRGLVG